MLTQSEKRTIFGCIHGYIASPTGIPSKFYHFLFSNFAVVLLAEDVDRNLLQLAGQIKRRVVLLAEDVDRNTGSDVASTPTRSSSSSRRTWIEMGLSVPLMAENAHVVLLAEDVDRNNMNDFLRKG